MSADPSRCPLCNQANDCRNLSDDAVNRCWCQQPQWHFPEQVLAELADKQLDGCCICRSCAEKLLAEN